MKYHIEKNSVQETLIIPLFGRLICSEHYPELFSDPSAKRICAMLDYDFSEKRKLMESQAGLFGALEVAQRQYDHSGHDVLTAHARGRNEEEKRGQKFPLLYRRLCLRAALRL